MPEFAGYKCDGPECNNSVDKRAPEARSWLMVHVENEGFKQDLTFCSYDCFEGHVHVTVMSQHPAYD